ILKINQINDEEIYFIIENEKTEKFINEIENSIFNERPDDGLFGENKLSIYGKENKEKVEKWWHKKIEKSIEIAKKEKSSFVYDKETILKNSNFFKEKMTSLDNIFYAIKANSNVEILKILQENGIGFECVSTGELNLIRKLF